MDGGTNRDVHTDDGTDDYIPLHYMTYQFDKHEKNIS